MKIELNDETLTAYALGELDAAETKQVELLLADAAREGNDAPRKMLDEIRAAVKFSEEAFAAGDASTALTDEQRLEVHAAAGAVPIGRARVGNRIWMGLAATVALLIGVAVVLPALSRAREAAGPGDGIGLFAELSTPPLPNPVPLETPAGDDLRYQAGAAVTVEGQPIHPSGPIDHAWTPDESIVSSDGPVAEQLGIPREPVTSDGIAPSEQGESLEAVPSTGDDTSLNLGQSVEGLDESSKDKEVTTSGVVAGTPLPEITADTLFSPAAPPAEPQRIEFRRRPRPESMPAPEAPRAPAAAAAMPAAPPAAPSAASPRQLTLSSPSIDAELQEQLKAVGYLSAESRARINVSERFTDDVDMFTRTQSDQLARVESHDFHFRPQPAPTSPGAEAYAPIADSPFVRVTDQPLSTFSIDVDTASYSNVRRFLQDGQLPPPNAVRVEELINYFDYAYPAPTDGRPFAAHFEAAACPWAPQHTLVRIGLKGREVPRAERPASNLVFLIDVSGSMQPENKLPLVKQAMALLTRQLDERDRVAIVTYASGVSLALPPTNAGQQDTILNAIAGLGAGGSTNGAGGIQLAYESARRNFLPGGVNRVILATDGDFNVGISDNDSLLALIQQEAQSGVFLSVFGFGMGNLKDDKLEMLADKGNGVYGYIDSESEARKVFVEKLSGTLVTIAKDVKIQVEFNPARVAAYKLIGYENRALAAQDFNDDRKDAGEIGAGHTVTALYEIVPTGLAVPAGSVDSLRYQQSEVATPPVAASLAPPAHADELLLVKLRYKAPEGAVSQLLEFPLKDQRAETMSADLKFASAVAAFGKLLRGNPLGATLNYDGMMQLAQAGLAGSSDPQRSEMIHLMLTARPMVEAQIQPEQRRYVQ